MFPEYINLSANVPGGIYTDLANNNIIGDIFYGFNDTETRWVAKKEWIYEKVFVGKIHFIYNNTYFI